MIMQMCISFLKSTFIVKICDYLFVVEAQSCTDKIQIFEPDGNGRGTFNEMEVERVAE